MSELFVCYQFFQNIGTPPRLMKETIDFSKTIVQPGDNPPVPFSFLSEKVWIKVCLQIFHYVVIFVKCEFMLHNVTQQLCLYGVDACVFAVMPYITPGVH